MWIKICGLTTSDAVAAALEARVDAIGFVFSPSVRQLTPGRARALALPARGRMSCVAVMREASQELVDEILEGFRPDELQADAASLAGLRLPQRLALLPVLRAGETISARLPHRFLFEGPASGSGVTADWSEARALARNGRLVLAGGLEPDNVSEAIEQVRPFGVDVSSGVEVRPGVKSGVHIARFAAAARAAFARAGAPGAR